MVYRGQAIRDDIKILGLAVGHLISKFLNRWDTFRHSYQIIRRKIGTLISTRDKQLK